MLTVNLALIPYQCTQNRQPKLFDGIEHACMKSSCYDNDKNDLDYKNAIFRLEEAELQEHLRNLETKRHQIQVKI